jgi:hypothetical protein
MGQTVASVYNGANMVTLPRVSHPATPAARLRAAIDASPYSVNSLAKAISERDDITQSKETIRRTLHKKLSGREAIGDHWATILESQLGLLDGELHEQDYSRILTLATQIVRRLDAGEKLPAETLVQIAEATEEAALAATLFADRLRRESQTQQ